MKLRIVTQAEKDLRGTEPQLWPPFMDQDQVVQAFWPRLYEVYADFQLWVLDGKRTVAYACTLPVRWDGIPEPRGLDWAMTNGVAGDPSDLCAIVVGVLPEYRGQGLSATLLRRMAGLASAHGLAPRSMCVTGSREEWEEWTGLQFPEDGDYVVPGALVPVRFEGGRGTYVEPNVWMRHPL